MADQGWRRLPNQKKLQQLMADETLHMLAYHTLQRRYAISGLPEIEIQMRRAKKKWNLRLQRLDQALDDARQQQFQVELPLAKT
jgi:hypothetical protein